MAGLFGLGGTKERTPTESLIRAVARGDLPGARDALQAGANIQGGKPMRGSADTGYKQMTPLHVAATNKDLEMMKILIDAGADVNARAGELSGVLPLQNAMALTAAEQSKATKTEDLNRAEKRRLDAVKLLLDNGADPKRTSRLGGSTLVTAVASRSLPMVNLLLSRGVSPNGEGIIDQPLAELARENDEKSAAIAQALISKGAKLEAHLPPNMETPLYRAAVLGNLHVAKVLVSRGAKINATDKFGSTPLHAAASAGRVEMVKFLLENGAGKKLENLDGQKPIDNARTEVIRELLK